MMTIWKYSIEPDFVVQEIEIQKDAHIISFGLDGDDRLCFWALVDSEAEKEKRLIACVGTGWSLGPVFGANRDREATFIGTVTHGIYVWHLFDLGAVAGKGSIDPAGQSGREEAEPRV